MTGSTAESPADLLDAWLGDRVDDAGLEWLRAAVSGTLADGETPAFHVAWSSAPRRVGRVDLSLSADDLARAAAVRPGWQPVQWTLEQAARALLLLALPSEDVERFDRTLTGLVEHGDLGELVALYQALPLLPHPSLHVARTAEGIRTNMKPVFEAIALRNPYPAEELDDGQWSQLVLKCLFVGSPLHLVHGVDARATRGLAHMLCDYAHERWAAGRPVVPELWRSVGPVAEGPLLADLERVLGSGTDRERAAVALATRHNPEAELLLQGHAALVERVLRAYPTWDAVAAG